jgi:hypothetical protein
VWDAGAPAEGQQCGCIFEGGPAGRLQGLTNTKYAK